MDPVDAVFTFMFIGGVVGAVCMLIAYRFRSWQDLMVYHPNTPEDSNTVVMDPSEVGIEHYEAIRVETSDGVSLHGYFLHSHPIGNHPPPFVLVYFHGNAGNVGHRLPIARLMMQSLRCSILMVDYRGYGLSDPIVPCEEGLKLDAQAVLDYLLGHPHVPKDKIFVLGTSLGGAVTIDLAARPTYARHIAGAIIENTFTSISDMADVLFSPMLQRSFPRAAWFLVPFLKYVVKPVVLFVGWWSVDTVRKIQCPMLFLSGAKDELVPPAHVKALHEVALISKQSDLVQFVEFPLGKHNDLFIAKGYTQSIDSFVKSALRRRQAIEVV